MDLEHTKNHEKRPAIFPVKTLDSITVVATPAAPTCLVGGTTSVALVVTAHYLTGTATSEAVVTTYTTGSNWANGVFTAATTVAGTENIVVTYTEGGVTKTANVAVTVSVEAPKVTTVTVTALTIEENQSKTAEVVVKDQFGNTMTTGFTLGYVAASSSVATVDSTGLVTAAAYNSALTTTNLTVTATPTTGTAVEGTAVITVTQDTTKPTMVSASALNNKTIVVTYSEKVKDSATLASGALNPANYSLYNASTGNTTALEASTGTSTTKIQATLIFSDTTQKVVKLTINNIGYGTAISGYVMGGLTDANYRLYASNVTDIAGTPNTIIANSNIQFTGTTTPDSAAPVLQKVEYNKGTGTLTLTFDKAMTNALSSYTKLKFNDTVLTGSPTVGTQPATNKIEMILTSTDKTTVAALTGDLTVTLLAGAVTDTNTTANAEVSMVATLTTPPTMTSASYDEATNTLTMAFDQTIDVTNSSLLSSNNIQLKSNEMTQFALDSTDTLTTTSNSSTLSVVLSSTHSSNIETIATHTSPKVIVAAGAFKNIAGTANLKQDDSTGYPAVAFTIATDTVKPAITSITFNESTKTLVFNFNVAVSRTFDGSKVKLFTDKDDTQIDTMQKADTTQIVPTEVTDSTTLSFDLSNSDAGIVSLLANLKTIQQGSTTTETPANYNAYFKIDASVFTKSGSSTLKNDAVSAKATATTVVYTDNVGPYLSTVTEPAPNQVTVTFTFDEKVNKTDAETVANYKIYLMNGSTKGTQLTINSALMTDATGSTWAQKSVTLITGTQTSGATYLLEISNVKDQAGNVISSTDAAKYSKTFTGSSTTAPAPAISSATIVDSDNSDSLTIGDKIKVVFDRPVKINTNSTAANANAVFALDANSGTAVLPAAYDKANIAVDSTDNKIAYLTITSSWSSGSVQVGQTKVYLATSQDYLVDKYSSVSGVTAVGSASIITPPGDTAAISEVTIEDVNSNGLVDNGDKVYVTFNKQVKLASGSWAIGNFAAYYDLNADGSITGDATAIANAFSTDGQVSSTITAATYGTTATITIGSAPAFKPEHMGRGAYLTFGAASTVTDKWNVGNAVFAAATTTTYKKIAAKNTIASPQIQTVTYYDVTGNGITANDYLVAAFNVPVYVDTTGGHINNLDNWLLGTGSFANAVTVTKLSTTEVKIVISNVEALADAKLDIKTAGTGLGSGANGYKLTNFNGNLSVVNGTGVAITAAATDNTRPSVVSAMFIDVDKMKIVFDKAVALGGGFANVGIESGTGDGITGATDLKGSAMSLDPTDTNNKTVIVTLVKGSDASAIDLTTFFGSNVLQTGYTSATHVAGLAILSGSTITNPASGLEVAAFGATATSFDKKDIAADTVAPTAPTALQLNNFYFNNVTGNAAVVILLFPAKNVRVLAAEAVRFQLM